MGFESDIAGVSRLEINESSIIGNMNIVLWMFWIIDRVSKNTGVLWVMNDRLKDKLLPYVKNNFIFLELKIMIQNTQQEYIPIVSHPIDKNTLLKWDMPYTEWILYGWVKVSFIPIQ